MGMINSIMMEGRLARDPEFLEFPSGAKKVLFTIACQDIYKKDTQESHAEYFDVEAWDPIFSYFKKRQLRKGDRVLIYDSTLRHYNKRRPDDSGYYDRYYILAYKIRVLSQKEQVDERQDDTDIDNQINW